MVLRQARAGDLAAIASFCTETEFSPTWTETAWQAVLRDANGVVLVAEEEESSVCGVVVGALVFDTITIENLVVAIQARRRGYARRLIAALLEQARDRGATTVELEVSSRNLAAQSLYASMGFEEQGLRKKYYANGDDAVLMGKRLADLPRS